MVNAANAPAKRMSVLVFLDDIALVVQVTVV